MFLKLILGFLFLIRHTKLLKAFDVSLSLITVPPLNSIKISYLIQSCTFISCTQIHIRYAFLFCLINRIPHKIFTQWYLLHHTYVKKTKIIVQ